MEEVQKKLNSLAAQSTLQEIINEQGNYYINTDVLTNLVRREQPRSLLSEVKLTMKRKNKRSPSSSDSTDRKKKKRKRDKKRKDKKHHKKRKYSSSSSSESESVDSGIGPQVPEDFYK